MSCFCQLCCVNLLSWLYTQTTDQAKYHVREIERISWTDLSQKHSAVHRMLKENLATHKVENKYVEVTKPPNVKYCKVSKARHRWFQDRLKGVYCDIQSHCFNMFPSKTFSLFNLRPQFCSCPFLGLVDIRPLLYFRFVSRASWCIGIRIICFCFI